jgi:hypothetical protein
VRQSTWGGMTVLGGHNKNGRITLALCMHLMAIRDWDPEGRARRSAIMFIALAIPGCRAPEDPAGEVKP